MERGDGGFGEENLSSEPSLQVRSRSGLAAPLVSLSVMALFAACVAIALRIAWNPPIRTYVEYLPIGAVLAGLIWDRLFPVSSADLRTALCDVAIVVLAAMRAIVPPFPFASGHTLLAAYAALTARHSVLRVIALMVLGQVVFDKLFLSGGAASMLIALVVAVGIARLRRPYLVPDSPF